MKIIIIGFMGSGKTTSGKYLAKKLELEFIDMDIEIEKLENRTIGDIFKQEGEQYFRGLETKLLKNLLAKDNVVISTGGGIITAKENVEFLKKQTNVVFLDASVDTILRNVSSEIDKRPLLKESNDLSEKISTMLSRRYDNYKEASNIRISVDNKNVEEVVSQILVYIR